MFVRVTNKYIQRVTGLKGFKFDEKGEYETDNEVIIKALEPTFEKAKPEPVYRIYQCKKCDFETDNKGYLMAHYRKEHKKENE